MWKAFIAYSAVAGFLGFGVYYVLKNLRWGSKDATVSTENKEKDNVG